MEKDITYTYDEVYRNAVAYFDGDEATAKSWLSRYALRDSQGRLLEPSPDDTHRRIARQLAASEAGRDGAMDEGQILDLLLHFKRLAPMAAGTAGNVASALAPKYMAEEEHILKRPIALEADVVRFQNNKEKWIAFIGLVGGRPYEIFTGLADDEEGIFCPKSVSKGKIIKAVDERGNKRYDFQFVNKRGYKTTIEGLSAKFNPEFWNYAKLISGVLRYGMPIDQVIKLVGGLELDNESINTWKVGVARALKKYLPDDIISIE